jgi:hypothetical protein
MDNMVLVITFTLLKFLPLFDDFKHRKISEKRKEEREKGNGLEERCRIRF